MMRQLKSTLIIAAASLVLAGCYGDHSELQQRMEQVRQTRVPPVELPSVRIESDEFIYEIAEDSRTPFSIGDLGLPDEGSDDDVIAEGPQPDLNRPREILEDFELDSLRMVGTFEVSGQNYALVEDPDDVIHRVLPGNYMGRNHGRVVELSDDRIQLTELVPDGEGRYREIESSLALDDIE